MRQYTYIATWINGNKDEYKAPSKKAARKEIERQFAFGMCPKLKYIRKKY